MRIVSVALVSLQVWEAHWQYYKDLQSTNICRHGKGVLDCGGAASLLRESRPMMLGPDQTTTTSEGCRFEANQQQES